MRNRTLGALGATLAAFVSLLAFALGEDKPAFKVEITNQAGRVLPADSFALVGIQQTLVAKVTPAVEGAEYEWTVAAPVLRTYEHDIQKPDKHKPIPLSAQDRAGQQLSFYWTKPQDGAEISVLVRKGASRQTGKATFTVRVPRDANRYVYAYADNDPLRNPNGLKDTYASSACHRFWHQGRRMSNGDLPVFDTFHDPAEHTVWGDVGYRNDPARVFGFDYNGGALLEWHGAILDCQRVWRRTFNVPDFDTAPPPGGLPVPECVKKVPHEKSAEQSRLYGYVRAGEFQDIDQLGREAVHPWHNRGHTAIAKTNNEPLMDDHSVSPPAKNDLFWRWHTIVEEVRRVLGPDRAAVTVVYPPDGKAASDASSVYVAFDRKVSANAPAANLVQLKADKVMVNGKPAKTLTDVGGDSFPYVLYRVTGFPAPADGLVKVELTGTPSYKGMSWSFTLKAGPKSADSKVPAEFRRAAEEAFLSAQARHRKEDVERILGLLKAPNADDIWLGYLFRTYPIPAEEGVPILVRLLDHPSEHVKAHAIQTLQYYYGPKATPAIPKLVALLNDKAERPWWVREWAARALGQIDSAAPAVLPALLASLQQKPANRETVEVLGRIGPKAREALAALRKLAAFPDPETQMVAYRAVGRVVNSPVPSLEELKKLKAVDWKAADGGYAVFRAIDQAGPRAAFVVPALLGTFRQKPPVYIQGAIIDALGRVGAGDAAAVRLLVDTLPTHWGTPGDPPSEKFLSDRAIDALALITPSDPQAVTVLAKALEHGDPLVRHQAAIALKKYGPKAEPAVPALVKALQESDGKTNFHQIGAYLDALRAIGPDAKAAVGPLTELLSERARLYRYQEKFYAHYLQAYLLVTLGDIGLPDGAKPYILDLLNNSDKTSAHGYAAAAKAVGTVAAQMPEAIPGLLRPLKPGFADFPMCFDRFAIALGRENSSCRLEALRALAKMGPKAAEAIPLVAPLVKEQPGRDWVLCPWSDQAEKTLRALRGKE